MTRSPTLVVAAAGLASFAMPGCVAVDNDRHTIGRGVPIETVTPAPAPGEPSLPDDGPSLSGPTRANWQRTSYLVPVDGTYHSPAYTFDSPTPRLTPRQRGVDPSPIEALDVGSTNGQQVGEALAAPFAAAVEVLAMVPRMFFEYPWVAVRSPGESPYERTRSNDDLPDAASAHE